MARTFTVKGRIEAEDAASGVVSRIQSSLSSLADTLASHFVVSAGDAERAMRLLVTAFTDSIGAAAGQQEVTGRLSAALANLKPGAEAGTAALLAQAQQLQATTRFSDEAVISAQALLATFGVAPEKIGKATQAAVDLAAALGEDLDTAARQLGGTFNGVTRGLDRLAPQLRTLSDEALRSGAAIDVLAERLQGRAVAAADNFTGRLTQLKNQLSEVQETVGGVVVESQAIADGLGLAAKATGLWNEILKETLPIAGEVLSRLNPTVTLVRDTAAAYDLLTKSEKDAGAEAEASSQKIAAAAELEFDKITQGIAIARTAVNTVLDVLDQFDSRLTRHENAVKRLARIDEEWAGTLDNVADVAKRLGVTIDADLNAQLTANRVEIEFVDAAYRDGILSVSEYGRIIAALAAEQTRLQASLKGTAAALMNVGNAAGQATAQLAEFARVNSSVDAGGLSLAGRIQFGGVDIVSGTVNGGNFTNIDGSPRRF